MVEQYRVNALFCAPTAMRAIRKEDPEGELIRRHDLSSLRQLFLAGEKLDSSTHEWLERVSGKPVHDHWWQTETGWPVTAPCVGLEGSSARPGSSNRAVPGYNVQVLDDEGRLLGPNHQAPSSSRCHCRRVAARPCGAITSATCRLTCAPIRAITTPAMAATWMTRARLHHGPHRRCDQRFRPSPVDW